MAIETPKYITLEKYGKIEIRRYEAYIEAFVEITSDYESALGQGFSVLAGYIFGGNKKRAHIAMTAPVTESLAVLSERIPMTAPVFTQTAGNETYKVSFMMPSKYTLETLPIPNKPEVRFKKIEAYKAAVLCFSGYLNSRTVHQKTEELLAWLADQKLSPKSAVSSAQYNPPWIPGWFRRNEILVEV